MVAMGGGGIVYSEKVALPPPYTRNASSSQLRNINLGIWIAIVLVGVIGTGVLPYSELPPLEILGILATFGAALLVLLSAAIYVSRLQLSGSPLVVREAGLEVPFSTWRNGFAASRTTILYSEISRLRIVYFGAEPGLHRDIAELLVETSEGGRVRTGPRLREEVERVVGIVRGVRPGLTILTDKGRDIKRST
jgi:hypothetical protein